MPAVGCQASRAGRCLMAPAPSITSGNELRVIVTAAVCICLHHQDSQQTPQMEGEHADGAQEERGEKDGGERVVGGKRSGQSKKEKERERKKAKQI